MSKKCLINVDGGLGKHVMLTSILPVLKKDYDEIYVISSYFDVFQACPYVTDAFPPGPACATLYQELVLDDDCDILWKEPYSNSKFIKKQVHLFDAWLEEFGYKGIDTSDAVPMLDDLAKKFPAIEKLAEEKAAELGKFIIVQFSGGQSPLGDMKQAYTNGTKQQEFIKRNYYEGQELINALLKKYPDCKILHYALPNEPSYENVVKLEVPYLTYRLLAAKAFKVVCIDSSLQHLVTGVCKDVTVIWGETRPEHFGYECNKNIAAAKVINSQPYFKPMGTSPSIVRMPSVEEVMAVVDK